MSFSNEDLRLLVKADLGPSRGKQFEILSFKGFEFDPGTKRKVITGRRQKGLFIATMAAEGKLSLEMTSAAEMMNFWDYLYGKQKVTRGMTTTLSGTLTRPGVVSRSWRWIGCQWPAPGLKGGDGGVEPGKVELPLLDAHLDGRSIYEE